MKAMALAARLFQSPAILQKTGAFLFSFWYLSVVCNLEFSLHHQESIKKGDSQVYNYRVKKTNIALLLTVCWRKTGALCFCFSPHHQVRNSF
jgi:hypothetical protein